jgi:hypothetical protein
MSVWVAILAIFIVPCRLIFKRAGWSPWLALTLIIPGAAIILMWVFALARWPSVDRPEQS